MVILECVYASTDGRALEDYKADRSLSGGRLES